MQAEPRRRTVLATAMALPLLAAGCKGVGALGTPPTPGPDVTVLREAMAVERGMIAGYDSAIAGTAELTAALSPLLEQHRQHLARMRSRLIVPAGSPATARARQPPVPAVVPSGTSAAVLAALEAAETRAASTLLRWLPGASPSLAQLLASIAASEASHAELLRSRGGTG